MWSDVLVLRGSVNTRIIIPEVKIGMSFTHRTTSRNLESRRVDFNGKSSPGDLTYCQNTDFGCVSPSPYSVLLGMDWYGRNLTSFDYRCRAPHRRVVSPGTLSFLVLDPLPDVPPFPVPLARFNSTTKGTHLQKVLIVV